MNDFFEQMDKLLCELGRKPKEESASIDNKTNNESNKKITIVVNQDCKKRVLKINKTK